MSYDNLNNALSLVFRKLKMPSLLKGAGFKKRNGFGASVSDIVFMLLSSCFYRSNKSIYGNFGHSDRVPVCTSKSSIYRFLSNERNNWRLLNLKLAKEVIDSFTKLSDADRRYCLILDDSMLESRKGKEVELLSRQYDHVSKTFIKGFNCLQLGWSDGVSYVPVASALLSTPKEENRYCEATDSIDKRTSGYKRRVEAMSRKPNVAVNLIKQSQNTGISADYVLMDSWFTTEPFIKEIKDIGLDVIGMVKPLRQRYQYKGQLLDLHKLFKAIPNKKSGDIICSAIVKTKGDIPIKLVFIRNRNCSNEYLALLSTDTSLDCEEIVRLYARRWLIETNFRAQKQYFSLGTESSARDYDNLFAFMNISSIRYIMLEFIRRYNIDERSLGELFRSTCQQLEDIPFVSAIESLMLSFNNIAKKLFEAKVLKKNCFAKAQKIITDSLSDWFTGICRYLKQILGDPIAT